MKSLLFVMFLLTFLSACSKDKPDDYIDLIPVKSEKPEKSKPIMDEITEQKNELEKLNSVHKYVTEEDNELN